MTDKPRRRFLKQSAAVAAGVAGIPACAPEGGPVGVAPQAAGLDRGTLSALAHAVLPVDTLGDEGVTQVISGFEQWLSDFEPVAELDHHYLWTDEIPYGPADPAPRWGADLEALEIEAQKRHGAALAELEPADRRAILERQLSGDLGDGLPSAAEARHVAIGLLSYFYATSQANDLCYDAAIEKQTCRGLESAPEKPETLRS